MYVSFQITPSPNAFFAINQQGLLAEMGWFLYPSFSFVNWQAQWYGQGHFVTVPSGSRMTPGGHRPRSSAGFPQAPVKASARVCSVRFDFYTELQAKLQTPAKVVPVFDKVRMQGERGAVATVHMPQGLLSHHVTCCPLRV